MNAYLVIVNHDPERAPYDDKYDPLYAAIKSYKPLVLSESKYIFIISTPDSIDETWRKIYRANAQNLLKQDCLYIIPVCKPFRGFGPPKFRAWFQEHFPDEQNEEESYWED